MFLPEGCCFYFPALGCSPGLSQSLLCPRCLQRWSSPEETLCALLSFSLGAWEWVQVSGPDDFVTGEATAVDVGGDSVGFWTEDGFHWC